MGASRFSEPPTLAPDAIPEPLDGTLVTLQGLEFGFTDTTTLDFDGNFSFDNLPGDTYTVVIVSPSGLFGFVQLTAEGEINDLIGVEMELFGSETTSSTSFVTVETAAAAALQAELLEVDLPDSSLDASSTSAIAYSPRVFANPLLAPSGQSLCDKQL